MRTNAGFLDQSQLIVDDDGYAVPVHDAVTAASSAGLTPSDISVVTQHWLGLVEQDILPFVSQTYSGSAVSVAVGLADGFPLADSPGVPLVPDEYSLTFLKTVTGDFVNMGNDVWEDAREVLVQGVQHGESIDQIAAKMRYVTTFSNQQAEAVARTVTHSAAEAGSISQLRFVGYADEEVTKEWVCTHDARTRPTHFAADKQRKKLNEKFTVGSSSLDFPGDPLGARDETWRCRCTAIFEVEEAPKLRCSTALTAAPVATASSTQCVTPTPTVDISSISNAQQIKIFNQFTLEANQVTPGYGGAAIWKVMQAARIALQKQGVDMSAVDDWQMLAVVDSKYVSKGAHTWSSKFKSWFETPAGQKATAGLKAPITHAVAPTTLPPPVDPFAPTPLPPVAAKPLASEIQYTGKTLGSHGAQVWQNPKTGERWLFKPQKQYATDIDIATSRLQSAAAQTRPGVYSIELNGQKGSIQYMFESTDAFPNGKFDVLKLSQADIHTLQEGQIFDWLVSNYDTHSGQWIRLKGGQLFGTDKGQAFKFFGSDKLDWDYVPVTPLGKDKLTYQSMWRAFVDGKKIDLKDPTVGPLGDYIDRLVAIPDDDFRAMFKAYAAEKGKPTPEAFLDALVKRKNDLKKDFAAFWQKAVAERAKHLPVTPTPVVTPPPVSTAIPMTPLNVSQTGELKLLANAMQHGVPFKMHEAVFEIDKFPVGNVVAYGKGPVGQSYRVVKVNKTTYLVQKQDNSGAWLDLSKYDVTDWKAAKQFVKDFSNASDFKYLVGGDPASLTPVPVVSPVTSPANNLIDLQATILGGNDKAPLDIFLSMADYDPGEVIGYAIDPQATMWRLRRDLHFPDSVTVEVWDPAQGGWTLKDTIDDLADLSNYSKTWKTKIPAKIAAPGQLTKLPSKVPGKIANQEVTLDEMEKSRFLWADGETAFYFDDASQNISFKLVSNGKGGFTLKYTDPAGNTGDAGVFSASTPLNNSYTLSNVKWKLSADTHSTSGIPTTVAKVKPSSMAGKNAGDTVTLQEFKTSSPNLGTDVIQLGYAYDPQTGYEYKMWWSYGEYKIQYKTPTKLGWSDSFYASDGQAFDDVVNKQTWYAATKNGGEPDIYIAVKNGTPLPINAPPPPMTTAQAAKAAKAAKAAAKALKPAKYAPPQNAQVHIPGKSVGDTVTPDAIIANEADYVDGQVIAEFHKPYSYKPEHYRIVKVDGKLIQQKQTKAGNWTSDTIITGKWSFYTQKDAWVLKNDVMTLPHYNAGKKFIEKKLGVQGPGGVYTPKPPPAPKPSFSNYVPAVSDQYTPLPLPQEAAKFVAAVPKTKVASLVPKNVDITWISDTAQDGIAHTFRVTGLTDNSDPQAIFNAMKKIAEDLKASDPAKYGNLTTGHVIRVIDTLRDKRKGLTKPSHTYEKKLATWWTQTNGGQQTVSSHGLSLDSPLQSTGLPKVMHRLDDPNRVDFAAQKYQDITPAAAKNHQLDMELKYGRLTREEADGIADYTGGHYTEINHAIRDGKVSTNHYRTHIENAIRAMRPSTRPVIVRRWTGFRELLGVNNLQDLKAHLKAGDNFLVRRLWSTTVSKKVTYAASQQFVWEIEAPTGTPMVYTGGARVSGGTIAHNLSEQEIIISPHTIVEITDIIDRDPRFNLPVIKVRVIGHVDPGGAL